MKGKCLLRELANKNLCGVHGDEFAAMIQTPTEMAAYNFRAELRAEKKSDACLALRLIVPARSLGILCRADSCERDAFVRTSRIVYQSTVAIAYSNSPFAKIGREPNEARIVHMKWFWRLMSPFAPLISGLRGMWRGGFLRFVSPVLRW